MNDANAHDWRRALRCLDGEIDALESQLESKKLARLQLLRENPSRYWVSQRPTGPFVCSTGIDDAGRCWYVIDAADGRRDAEEDARLVAAALNRYNTEVGA